MANKLKEPAVVGLQLYKTIEGEVQFLVADATLSSSHQRGANTLQHPVESGSQPIDHVQILPISIAAQLLFSNTSRNNIPPTSETRAYDQYSKLVEFQRAREPFRLDTGLDIYPSMVLGGISAPRSIANGTSIVVDVVFNEYIEAETQNTVVPKKFLRSKRNSKTTKDGGKQASKEAKKGAKEKGASILKGVVDGAAQGAVDAQGVIAEVLQ